MDVTAAPSLPASFETRMFPATAIWLEAVKRKVLSSPRATMLLNSASPVSAEIWKPEIPVEKLEDLMTLFAPSRRMCVLVVSPTWILGVVEFRMMPTPVVVFSIVFEVIDHPAMVLDPVMVALEAYSAPDSVTRNGALEGVVLPAQNRTSSPAVTTEDSPTVCSESDIAFVLRSHPPIFPALAVSPPLFRMTFPAPA